MDTDPAATGQPLSLKWAKFAVAVEKTILPWVFAFLASQRLIAALKGVPEAQELFYASLAKDVLLFIQNILLFILIALYGGMLLLSRPATVLPSRLKHILVPMAMSYFFLFYGMLGHLPLSFRENLLPPALQLPFSIAGVVLSLLGYSIAIWALVYLRRSFAILVSVREVVSKGPYAYIRHPMYLGYLFDLCGFALVSFSVAVLLLGGGFVVLLVWRARMEEETLREASASYRSYASHTGFLFPRLGRSGPPTVS